MCLFKHNLSKIGGPHSLVLKVKVHLFRKVMDIFTEYTEPWFYTCGARVLLRIILLL